MIAGGRLPPASVAGHGLHGLLGPAGLQLLEGGLDGALGLGRILLLLGLGDFGLLAASACSLLLGLLVGVPGHRRQRAGATEHRRGKRRQNRPAPVARHDSSTPNVGRVSGAPS